MKLVYEDEFGAYLGVRTEFLKKFVPVEINPNFEVYDSSDGNNRFIVSKSSRIPDDEDLVAGRFGIDFNRGKPALAEALEYGAALPRGYKWLGDIAFAAHTQEEYAKKAAVWDSFYSFIWDTKPQMLWVIPHSGSVNIPPDTIRPFPKLMTDAFTGGVAALCAFNNKNKASKRIMISVHGTGLLGAVLNLGDFGVLNNSKMEPVIKMVEKKYHKKVQTLADEFKQDYCLKTSRILEHINKKNGTLNPEELSHTSIDDSGEVKLHAKALKLYGQEIKKFTLDEFQESLRNLGMLEVPVLSNNYLYSARRVGKSIRLSEKIEKGQLYAAILIECAKLYLAKAPELVANILLDVKNELFT
ncbi:MAG: hypothetical protein ACYDG5_00020 [Dehalococcoidales bacterium]